VKDAQGQKGRRADPPWTRREVWLLSRFSLPDPPPLNGELSTVSPRVRQLLELLGQQRTAEDRALVLQTISAGLGEQDLRTLMDVDPWGGEPPAEPAGRPLPDRSPRLDALVDPPDGKSRFLWMNRLVRGHLNIVSSDPKVGKTTLFLELARRLWFGLLFPDEAELILPAKTITLWVCGDRHHDELKERARLFGLPDEAISFCAWPENPYGNCSLDDDDTIKLMEHYVVNEHPGIIFIDTIWRATARRMKVEEEVNALFDPIIEIAQKTNATIFCASHLSKDGDTLGRRLEAVARSVMKLYKPDPGNQPDRRKLTTMGNSKQPDDLGMTIHEDRIDFDHSPPKEPQPEAPARRGRPKSASGKARDFLCEALQGGPQVYADLLKRWLAMDGAERTLGRVKQEMIEAGMLEATSNDPETLTLVAVVAAAMAPRPDGLGAKIPTQDELEELRQQLE
jgi:hypothetical protein